VHNGVKKLVQFCRQVNVPNPTLSCYLSLLADLRGVDTVAKVHVSCGVVFNQIARSLLKKFMTVTCQFWASDKMTPPIPPKTPFLTPHTSKKGVNMLRIQAAICLHSSHARLFYT
jgi:hypothetical protein